MTAPNMRSLLIINLGGIGDLLLSTGALSALRAALPHTRIDLLAVGRGVDFMKPYGLFDNLYRLKLNSYAAVFSELYSLRNNRYDLAVNMRTIVSKTAGLKLFVLMKAIGAKQWAGRDTDGNGFYFDIKTPETLITDQPEFLFDAATVLSLGIPVPDPAAIYVPVTEADKTAAQATLRSAGILPGDTVIGINPGGAVSHRWPAERFIEAIRLIQKQCGAKFVVTGSSAEQPLCRHIAREISAADLSGVTETIGQLAAVIERCRLFLSNDTGPMHVSVAVGTPGVFLFGPGHLRRYAPFKDPQKHIVISVPTPCAPCEKHTCGDQSCMRSISVDSVVAAMRAQIEKNTPAT